MEMKGVGVDRTEMLARAFDAKTTKGIPFELNEHTITEFSLALALVRLLYIELFIYEAFRLVLKYRCCNVSDSDKLKLDVKPCPSGITPAADKWSPLIW